MHNLYYPVYKNLENEVIELAYKIHFDDDQLVVYSIKIAELLVRCCVETEAISKDLYLNNGGKIEKDINGNEMHLSFDKKCLGFLEEKWLLSKKIVYTSSPNFYFTETENKILTPLDKAGIRGKDGSEWKYAYQKVKHNRSQNIKDANVKNLIHAMAALYLLNIYHKNPEPQEIGTYRDEKAFNNTLSSSLFFANTFTELSFPNVYTAEDLRGFVYIRKFTNGAYETLCAYSNNNSKLTDLFKNLPLEIILLLPQLNIAFISNIFTMFSSPEGTLYYVSYAIFNWVINK